MHEKLPKRFSEGLISEKIVAIKDMVTMHQKLSGSSIPKRNSQINSSVRFILLVQAVQYEESILMLGGSLPEDLQKELEVTVFDYLKKTIYEVDKSAYTQIYPNTPYRYEIERLANAVIERDGLENPLFDVPQNISLPQSGIIAW